MTNLFRAFVVVFPGAFLWGMSFPFALANLGRDLGDAARPVGRLYAYNTIGAVIGSLATSFVLIPLYGSSAGAAHLLLIPLTAAVLLLLPRTTPRALLPVVAMAVVVLAFLTPLPHAASETLRQLIGRLDDAPNILFILGVPTIMGIVVAMLKWVRHGWAYVLTCAALTAAFVTTVPVELYMLGRNYATRSYARETSTVLLFEEGAMEPVVVFLDPTGMVGVSINSKVCASDHARGHDRAAHPRPPAGDAGEGSVRCAGGRTRRRSDRGSGIHPRHRQETGHC